jgi:hypothetical protein
MKKAARPKAKKPVAKKKAKKAKKPTTVSIAKYNDLKKQAAAMKKYLGDIRRVADKATKPKAKKKAAPKRKGAPKKRRPARKKK